MKDFSWSVFCLVTGISSLLFSGLLKLLEGDFSPPFLWVGFSALFLSSFEWLGKLMAKSASRKQRRKRSLS